MSKVLLGVVTFGNTMFSIKAIESCLETCKHPLDVFVVVGKPGDIQTKSYLEQKNIPHIVHEVNKGFPASINDIYDYGFKERDYDYIIFAGNDIIAYPYALDNLIEFADLNSNCTAVSSQEINVRDIVNFYPETRQFFAGSSYITSNLDHKSWEKYQGYIKQVDVVDGNGIIDIHNLCLYKRVVFETIGYIDVNFFPAYFEDNDYVIRMGKTGLLSCTINSKYFHFWSRTLYQEGGGSNGKYFNLNRKFYQDKWGGNPHNETYELPFNGKEFTLTNGLNLPSILNIQSRDLEPHIINYWRSR